MRVKSRISIPMLVFLAYNMDGQTTSPSRRRGAAIKSEVNYAQKHAHPDFWRKRKPFLAGAKAKVLEMGVNMSISVVDPRGDLITMMRTDGASWRTPPISRAKAVQRPASGAPAAN